jgi:3-deoxy-D-manno-octulosonate 8-phosphate phosphatase (KDO 8-P phosphatase)
MKLFKRKVDPRQIAAIIFDFDGVFTDNKVIVTEDGHESVTCNRADGLGIKMLREKQIPLLILSTERNRVVAARAEKLALEHLQGVADKKAVLIAYCAARAIDLQKVMYVGNDLNDLEAMKIVGYPVAPRDAHPEIRRLAKYIVKCKGGEGVVKELAENWIR